VERDARRRGVTDDGHRLLAVEECCLLGEVDLVLTHAVLGACLPARGAVGMGDEAPLPAGHLRDRAHAELRDEHVERIAGHPDALELLDQPMLEIHSGLADLVAVRKGRGQVLLEHVSSDLVRRAHLG